MDTESKLGIKKNKAIMLFVQMILTILLLAVSVYLLIFVISNNLGGYMISSYILITISVLAIICYGIIGYKKGEIAYLLAVIPFLGAIMANILLPQRNAFQIALLTLLFALTFAFLLRQKDKRFTYIIALSMLVVSLTFSIYSSITANLNFLGNVSDNWLTYLAMYLSIFVPTIMSTTILVTYNVRVDKATK
ncbi:MAG: hypothetical protein II467_00635 [Bacilli bacterium]|nr:hypothetical protein [Bacilli bacterium]